MMNKCGAEYLSCVVVLTAEVKVLVLVLDVNDKPHLKPVPGR